MSEPTVEAKTTEEAPAETSSESCKGAGCCRPHTALYIAVIALLLAGYSVFISASANNSVVEEHLKTIDSQVSSITSQIESLGNDIKSNRESLIQTKLQRALTSIEEIGGMATEETRATIAEVEKMLRALTSATGAPEAPAVVEPETPAIDEAAPVEAAPAAEAPVVHDAAPAIVKPEAAPAEEPAAEAPVETLPSEPQAF